MDYIQPGPKELILAFSTLREVELRAQRNKRHIRRQLKALFLEWSKERGLSLKTWESQQFAMEKFAQEFMLDPTQTKRILGREVISK